jgi:hypothetical protein
MHILNVMDKKFDSMCIEIFNIYFTIKDYLKVHNNSMDEANQVPTSIGTPSNPILFYDETNNHIENHYWRNQGHGPQG